MIVWSLIRCSQLAVSATLEKHSAGIYDRDSVKILVQGEVGNENFTFRWNGRYS